MSGESESGGGWSTGGLFVFVGALLLVGGVIAYFYEELRDETWLYSYRWLAVLLIALGIASIIAEVFLHFYTPKKQTPQPTP